MSDSSTVSTPQTDYKMRDVYAPIYKHVRVTPVAPASSSIGISPTSSTMLEFKLPTLVYNLARSYISYSLNVPGQQAQDERVMTFEDVIELASSVQFGVPGGINLVDLQYAQNYTKIARKIDTKMEDYLSNDDMSGLYKSNQLSSANVYPVQYLGGPGAVLTYDSKDNYLGPKYIQAGPAPTAGGGASPPEATGQTHRLDRYRQFPLSAYSGTMLADDRDFYSPVEMRLAFNVGVGDKVAFISTDAAAPATGAKSVPDLATSTTSTAGKGVTFNNIVLYLCVEKNKEVSDSIIQEYLGNRLKYRIPYTTAFRAVGAPAGQQTNIQITLSTMYGKRLKRILHTVWNPQEKHHLAYDCNNWDGAKIASYQTSLDNLNLQDRILSCKRPSGLLVNEDDWLENKKFLDKRSSYVSKEMYALNWFHIDQFFEPHDKDSQIPEANLDEGVPMDTSRTWQFSGLTGGLGGAIHYTYAEFSRDVLITNAGPQLL